MGTTNPAGPLQMQIRQNVLMEKVLKRYQIGTYGAGPYSNPSYCHCRCPLPTHPPRRKKSFRVYGYRWKCLSETCTQRHTVAGNDDVAFVAMMAECSREQAVAKLRAWFPIRPA
jgi:hypothetical protein